MESPDLSTAASLSSEMSYSAELEAFPKSCVTDYEEVGSGIFCSQNALQELRLERHPLCMDCHALLLRKAPLQVCNAETTRDNQQADLSEELLRKREQELAEARDVLHLKKYRFSVKTPTLPKQRRSFVSQVLGLFK